MIDHPLRLLGIGQIVTGLMALAAVALAIVAIGQAAESVHSSRLGSARDSCRLNRGLVLAAVNSSPRQQAAARAYIARTSLRNCTVYAREIVR